MNLGKLSDKVLYPLGLKLSRINKEHYVSTVQLIDPSSSYMETPEHTSRLIKELADTVSSFISEHFNNRNSITFKRVKNVDIVASFFDQYLKRPVLDNAGGSGFHNFFWLYVITKYLNPSLIVESGVWKGQTSWIFRRACLNATIHGFDINLNNLIYKDNSINFHEMDWSQFDLGHVDPNYSLCFFDCHVNQAKRVREAYDKGFSTLIFDDNPPVYKLYGYGLPGLPTVDMLLDESVKPDDQIKWVWQGQEKSYVYNKDDEYSARELIKRYVVFPDVGGNTKYGGFSFLTLVELVE